MMAERRTHICIWMDKKRTETRGHTHTYIYEENEWSREDFVCNVEEATTAALKEYPFCLMICC